MALPPKSVWRAEMLKARRGVAPPVRQAEASLLRRHLADAVNSTDTVAAYIPITDEPGSTAMLDRLLAQGIDVLVPVVVGTTDGPPQPLHWAQYRGADELVRGSFGIPRPAGEALAPHTLASAGLVVVPALAVDHRGTRLGRGAGYYDRSLPLCAPGARLVAMIRDDEFVDALPADPHDVPMTHVLTPARGLSPVGAGYGGE